MSSDLFAAFGDFPQAPASQGSQRKTANISPHDTSHPPSTAFSFFDELSSLDSTTVPSGAQNTNQPKKIQPFSRLYPVPPALRPAEPLAPSAPPVEDDDWGEFEDAGTQALAPPAITEKGDFPEPWRSLGSVSEQVKPPVASEGPLSTGQEQSSNANDLLGIFSSPPRATSVPKLAQPSNPLSVQKPIQPIDFANLSSASAAPKPNDDLDIFVPPRASRVARTGQPPLQGTVTALAEKPAKISDPNVLFDATDDFNDEDFGDFEGATPSPPGDLFETQKDLETLRFGATGTVDLRGKQERSRSTISQTHPRVPPVKHLLEKAPSIPNSQTTKLESAEMAAKPSEPKRDGDDAWDDFADWEPTEPSAVETQATTRSTTIAGAPCAIPEPGPNELPPTNVPPPALLLTLFPPLFTVAQKQLFQPLARQPYKVKDRIVTDPGAVKFLQGYLAIATVTARIIAGRKLRWKRDNHLAQGMRIGPASGRSSGMKLAGIDRSEAMKEEREVLDVVRAWREQVGRLRSAVAAAHSAGNASLGAVPEIQDIIPVRVAKQTEGGVPAPNPCALCGLKRDERVHKVDMDVQDSFGEWWIDQLSMHRACRNFWEEHKDKLRGH